MSSVVLSIDEVTEHANDLRKKGELDEAEALFRRVLSEFGWKHLKAQLYLGVLLCEKGKFHEAFYRFNRAIQIDRRCALARSNYGMVLGQLGHHEEALSELTLASHHEPNNPIIWNNIGNTLIFLERHKEAIHPLRRCLDLDPHHEMSHYNMGIALFRLGDIRLAIKHLEHALLLDPSHHEARFNLGLGQLLLGDYVNGFKNYEYRWDTANYAEFKTRFPQQKWIGDPADLTGKKVLLYGDQGLGDLLMFARYIPLIQDRGAEVYLAPHKELHDLMSSTYPGATMLRHGDQMPDVDYRIPLPSCPLAFETTLETIPPPVPFKVPPDKLEKRSFFENGIKVGICWRGNFKHINDNQRSIPFSTFSRLLGVDDVQYCRLQLNIEPVDQEAWHKNSSSISCFDIKDYADTIAILKTLDVLVTVDTSVAHAAATIGVPTWILIPTPRIDWRWGQEGATTPWYESVRLYRQPKPGDWETVFRDIRRDLRALVAAKTSKAA